MNIVSPVDGFNEAESLIGSGANELYGGYLPDFWIEKYGHMTSLNRRSFRAANIASFEELDRICELCWKKDVPFHLVLNAPIVPEGDLAPVVDFASELAARGVSGFIVSDLNLLSRLSEARLKVELHASTLLAAFSLATIRFFTSFGVRRVILSRELALGETCELAKKAGEAKLDIIAFRGKCPNIEGYCSHLHDDPDRRWPCQLPYRKKWVGAFEKSLKDQVFENISEWEGLDPFYSCGICALPQLASSGVHSARIEGRGLETEKKLRAVAVLRKMLEFCKDESDLERSITIGRSIYVEEFGMPCSQKNCYFPEFFNGEKQ